MVEVVSNLEPVMVPPFASEDIGVLMLCGRRCSAFRMHIHDSVNVGGTVNGLVNVIPEKLAEFTRAFCFG